MLSTHCPGVQEGSILLIMRQNLQQWFLSATDLAWIVRLLLLEGLPGSGKTTTAEIVCRRLRSVGIASQWYLEETADHPVHPRSVTSARRGPEFSAICLKHWQLFVEKRRDDETLHILEGSAFQSTVRFMMEEDSGGIDEYFSRFQALVEPLAPAFVYFRPDDAVTNSRYISRTRGEVWTETVTSGETRTPYSVRHDLSGVEGMHVFWARYAELCEALLQTWDRPKKLISFTSGCYARHVTNIWTFLQHLGVVDAQQRLQV